MNLLLGTDRLKAVFDLEMKIVKASQEKDRALTFRYELKELDRRFIDINWKCNDSIISFQLAYVKAFRNFVRVGLSIDVDADLLFNLYGELEVK